VTKVWSGSEVKTCRFHLGQSWWPKIQFLGLGKQNGSKISAVLEENIWTVAFTTSVNQRLLCVLLYIQCS
jgi:hypothetical protein